MSEFAATTFAKEPITKDELTRMSQGIASAHTELQAHLDDSGDAHDASAISNIPAGNIAATDVQAAINELDTEKAGLGLDNTFTQRQTFQGGIQDGDGNQDTSFPVAFQISIDTRSAVATAWNANNQPTTIEYRDGVTVVGTLTLTWNALGKLDTAQLVAGGRTVTWTNSWTGDRWNQRTKVVV